MDSGSGKLQLSYFKIYYYELINGPWKGPIGVFAWDQIYISEKFFFLNLQCKLNLETEISPCIHVWSMNVYNKR